MLTWGPDPATHNHCCFGGMIGNNSCGAHAQMSGKTDNNIEELEVLLYDGTRMTVGWMTRSGDGSSRSDRAGARATFTATCDRCATITPMLIREELPADSAPRLRLQP